MEREEPSGARERSPARRLLRLLGLVALAVALVALAAGIWAYGRVRASLPRLDGELALGGLTAPVTVERDELGVPTLRGESRDDVARALGFVHAQDRFFQMDLLRRSAAGELSELLGEGPLPADRRYRTHRFRARAERALAARSPRERALLEAYGDGVNAGLADLGAPPFEYLLLGREPRPWRLEDTFLIVYAMYFDLHDWRATDESAFGLIHELLGPEMLEFLAPLGSRWDAPMIGEPFAPPAVPGPEVVDLRAAGRAAATRSPGDPSPAPGRAVAAAGSNNWALAGWRSASGGALLANDMHLGISVPNTWYRASLVYPDPQRPGQERRITGVTLPGAPVVVVGSNGRVAWGFTNTWGDWEDLVVIEPEGEDAYRTADGPRPFERRREVLRVAGGGEEVFEVVETVWGPIVDEDHRGRRRALRWVAHDVESANLELLALEGASDVEEAMAIANRIGAPPQNFVTADAAGRVGWTVMGRIPRRFGHDGRLPTSWADGSRGWDGYLDPAEVPRILDPASGLVWTANARVVEGEAMARIGLGHYRLAARAHQIRDALLPLESADEGDMLAIQLDDRALFLAPWRELLLEVLTAAATARDPRREELRQAVADWGGRAAVDSVGYRMVRAFRLFLLEQVGDSLTAACREADEEFRSARLRHFEDGLWRLLEVRPRHLLDPRFESWDEQLLAAVDATLDHFLADGSELSEHTWGARNTARIRHPLSAFVPLVGRWLDMPPDPLPGDDHMPRVQGPDNGASERLVVSPGREEHGIFHMPAGQSGHPLSPFYRAGHAAWVKGEPTPFLPGPTLHTLTLLPPR